MVGATCRIQAKLPSCNDYTKACRTNQFLGAKMKRNTQDAIGWFIKGLPRFENPVTIDFIWIEQNAKRDLDNISFAKKFILDALVENGVLINDSPKYVVGFTDTFEKGKETEVIITIKEAENDTV